MTRILTVGFAVLDEIFVVPSALRPGEKHRATAMRTAIGGNAAAAALAIARLGGAPMLIARLGDDAVASTIRARLADLGIDTSLSQTIAGTAAPRSSIVIEPNGDRTIVNFLDPTLPDLPDWLPRELPRGTAAVLGDIRWESGAKQLFALARKAGIPAVFDGERMPDDPALLQLASYAVLSAEGARQIAREDDLEAALLTIARGHDGFIAATNGAAGVFAVENGKVRRYPAFAIEAVDTLAAGDIWHGAFTLAIAEGQPIEAAIPFASAAAAIKCTRPGGSFGAPTRVEVERFLAEPHK